MTKNDIFNKALKQQKEERLEKVLESKNYLKNLYQYNGVLPLVNKLGELKIKKAKLEVENQLTDAVESEIKQSKVELLTLLKQYNIDTSNLYPHFICKKCNDIGFVNDEICECLNNKYINMLLDCSEINLTTYPILDKINTEQYSNKEQVDTLIKNLEKNIDAKKFNTIVFSGETGTGKTFIAKSLLKTYITSKKSLGLFIDGFKLGSELLSYHTTFEHNKNLDRFIEPDILVIDDLGTENIYKNVTLEYLLYILNERQQHNKLTIFTTNLTLLDIKARYTDRFFSRLLDKEISYKFNFVGKDLRQ